MSIEYVVKTIQNKNIILPNVEIFLKKKLIMVKKLENVNVNEYC